MRKVEISKMKTLIKVNNSVEDESLENKIKKVLANNEPIESGSPIIYTERKDGVLAQYNVRTDRFEIANEAMDKVAKSHQAKRMNAIKEREELKNPATGANPSDNKIE